MKPSQKVCSECGKERERCRAASVDAQGEILWVCRACWRALGYDEFLPKQVSSRGIER